jgi:hypothetical protein
VAQFAVERYDAMMDATKKGTKYMMTRHDEVHAWLLVL